MCSKIEEENDLVSVIMPVFGRTDYLNESIKSVTNQSYKNIELIIVNDNDPGSVHGIESHKIIQQHLKNKFIKYIRHKRNMNGAVARNTGLSKARGKYISFIDSDDFYVENRIKKAVELLRNSDNEVGGFYSGIEFRVSGNIKRKYKNVRSGKFLKETLACRFMIGTGSNLFIKKNVIKELDGFDKEFLRHQDYEFLVRFFLRYKLVSTSEILVIKNNENFNAPNYSILKSVKTKYLKKYKKPISNFSNGDRNYIYGMNFAELAEAALKSRLKDESKYMYHKASKHGINNISLLTRRIFFSILNFLR